jgi:hypothetical protein
VNRSVCYMSHSSITTSDEKLINSTASLLVPLRVQPKPTHKKVDKDTSNILRKFILRTTQVERSDTSHSSSLHHRHYKTT